MTKLSLCNLELEYPSSVRAIDGLELTVNAGERMVLLGPSGCGKTTTLRLIAGLLRPTGGDVLFDDQSVLHVPAERRGAVMVFQDHTLFPFKTVAENVAFGLKLRKVKRSERRERVAEALSAVQLSGFEDRWPDELSGGQRQRIALARALVVRPGCCSSMSRSRTSSLACARSCARRSAASSEQCTSQRCSSPTTREKLWPLPIG